MKTFFRHYQQELGFTSEALLGVENFYRASVNPYQTISTEALLSYIARPNQDIFCGHNIIESNEFPLLSGADHYVPVSPLFVKDLAGRTIYLGMGPEQKQGVEWSDSAITDIADISSFDTEMILAAITFPRTARSTIGMSGADELETVFLTRFRNLEIAMAEGDPASGGDENEIGVYDRANLYPYKLRPDTFYIDGYKLPQTTMLFARGPDEGINPTAAQKLGEALLDKWQNRSNSPGNVTTWEKFTTDNGGESWLEDLFSKGCTIIPTFEACNGYHVVNTDFELTDYWPGRAVLGLHTVKSSRQSKAPIGTILEVLKPGFITAQTIMPATVVISDGSGYVSPHAENPAPMIPNLHLPHGRSLSQWGTCWLPTHPGHFEVPALWGYDVLDTQRFVQLSGPLWDPLHYYYASTESILKAFDQPNSFGTQPAVPANMFNRFFPIAAPEGFDTFSAAELERRSKNNIYPRTAIIRHRNGKPGCDFGYHPLPLEYEYELEPFWLPDQHPLNREHGLCPDELLGRMAPVIIPPIGPGPYVQTLQVPDAAPWFKSDDLLAVFNVDPVACYPQLARYVLPDLEPNTWLPLFPAPYIADPRRELLTQTPQQLWEGMDEADDLQAIAPGLYDAVWDAKEEALTLMRYRHAVYRIKKLLYTLAWWYGLNADDLTVLDREGEKMAAENKNTRGQNTSRVGQVARAAAQGAEAPPEQRRRAAPQAAAMPVVREG